MLDGMNFAGRLFDSFNFKDFSVIKVHLCSMLSGCDVVCVCRMRFDCFYGLLGSNVFRNFSKI